jgi:hypothetical protein
MLHETRAEAGRGQATSSPGQTASTPVMETLAEPPESGGADFSTTVLGQIAALTPATAHAESIRQHVLVAQLPVAEVSNLSMVMGAANTALSRATELRAQVLQRWAVHTDYFCSAEHWIRKGMAAQILLRPWAWYGARHIGAAHIKIKAQIARDIRNMHGVPAPQPPSIMPLSRRWHPRRPLTHALAPPAPKPILRAMILPTRGRLGSCARHTRVATSCCLAQRGALSAPSPGATSACPPWRWRHAWRRCTAAS